MQPKKQRSPRYGDVIGVDRGLYQHYGVYVSPDSVIEYGSENGDFGGEIRVQEVSLEKFLDGATSFFICTFPDMEQSDMLVLAEGMQGDWMQMLRLFSRAMKGERYHLYTPEQTVQRARSKLGENQYNLLLNNCEHFAIWCKTGVSESGQVERILRFLGHTLKEQLVQAKNISKKRTNE